MVMVNFTLFAFIKFCIFGENSWILISVVLAIYIYQIDVFSSLKQTHADIRTSMVTLDTRVASLYPKGNPHLKSVEKIRWLGFFGVYFMMIYAWFNVRYEIEVSVEVMMVSIAMYFSIYYYTEMHVLEEEKKELDVGIQQLSKSIDFLKNNKDLEDFDLGDDEQEGAEPTEGKKGAELEEPDFHHFICLVLLCVEMVFEIFVINWSQYALLFFVYIMNQRVILLQSERITRELKDIEGKVQGIRDGILELEMDTEGFKTDRLEENNAGIRIVFIE
ncbi:hypothetical protein GCK72_003374 [Caenorhabditis remanei]|uniref:Uncharacterized protein n=1 Tax=Caenorhabditis remanei TaxID=31234 RepID=A0A6A5HY39_CAERE|nr:hypothetical protein GCK72_003374 [Caenorhabditis remanei]KAF1771547.1 hypothetical protein GCK72_003374 [Caenorhabditis remanei]